MNSELVVAPCSYEASKFACENFHYSQKIPPSKLVKYGVWENGLFIGAIIFGDSTNFNIGSPYGLNYTEVCELERVALTTHTHPVTQILSKSLKLLHKSNPNLQLVVSYADTNQGHLGIIYQANNWIYVGKRPSRYLYIINGERLHGRTVHDRYGRSDLEYIRKNIDKEARTERINGKHKYIYPLTKTAKKKFSHLAKPYPKEI